MKKAISILLAVVVLMTVCVVAPVTANAKTLGKSNLISVGRQIGNIVKSAEDGTNFYETREILADFILSIDENYENTSKVVTPESLEKYDEYLNQAKLTAADLTASDEECTFAAYNLEMSYVLDLEYVYDKNYVQVTVEQLQDLVDNAELYGLDAETVASINELIEQGKALIAKQDLTEEEVKEYITLVNNAIMGTDSDPDYPIEEVPLTKEDLQYNIDWANEVISSGNYTEDELTDVVAAVENANKVIANTNATDTEIEDAYNAIDEAVFALPESDVDTELTAKEALYNTISEGVFYVLMNAENEEVEKDTLLKLRDSIIDSEGVYLNENSTETEYFNSTINLMTQINPSMDIMYGDFNADGELNISDVTSIQKYVADLNLNSTDEIAGDVDGDYEITIKDATLIQKRLADQISVFPVEEAVG